MASDAKDFAILSAPRDVNEITRSNQLNSPLLRLPGEIRNRIYEYVFFGSEMIVRRPAGIPSQHRNFESSTDIHVLATCQQVRHEATSTFWEECIIDAEFLSCPSEVESSMGLSNYARITSLRLVSGAALKLIVLNSCPTIPYTLAKLPRLRKLYVYNLWFTPSVERMADLLRSVSVQSVEVEYEEPSLEDGWRDYGYDDWVEWESDEE